MAQTRNRQWCCVPLCTNNKQKQPYMSFHTFPRDVDRRRAWQHAIKRDGPLSKISSSTVLCSMHFRSGDLFKTRGGFNRVQKDAVPSIFRSESCERLGFACGHEGVAVAPDHDYDPRPSPELIIGKRKLWIFGSSNGTTGEVEEKTLSCDVTETHQVDLRLLVKEEDIKEEEYDHMICQVKEEGEEKPFAEPHCKIESDNTDETDSSDETLQTPVDIEVEIEEDEQHDYRGESVSEHLLLRQQKIHGRNDQLHLQLRGSLHHCTVCRKSFTARRELQKHQQTHTTGVAQKQNTDPNCGLNGKRISTLKTPIHSGKKRHQCTLSEDSFVKFTPLKRHMHAYIGDKPHKCCQCGEAFSQSSSLNRHMLTHTGEKPHKCVLCGKAFSQNSDLKRHMLTHTGEKLKKNGKWGEKAFTLSVDLKRHVHSGKKPHKCVQCGKCFSRIASLDSHMHIHGRQKVHICIECGKVFSQSRYLTKHMVVHSEEKLHECFQCERAFRTSQNLKRHMLTHTGEKPHTCVECGKAFGTYQDLKRHMRTHTGEKPHTCVECGKAFGTYHDLKRHMRTHTGEKPHECAQCGKAFSKFTGLKRHMATHTDSVHRS